MCAKTCMGFCNQINRWKNILLVLVCFKITFVFLYTMLVHLKGANFIQPSYKRIKKDNFVYLSKSNYSKIVNLVTNETLGKFYYIPGSRNTKKLYRWKAGNIIQVDDLSVLRNPFTGSDKEENSRSSFTFTRPNVTSKNNLTSPNCSEIRKEIDEFSNFVFQDEIDVRIAYSILVYTDYEMFELLLRTIYKPQNTFCIHIDTKSSTAFQQRVRELAACFDNNVFIATNLVSVNWGTISVVTAELSCMKDLLNRAKSWKYFINLTGQEFPLRTNYEIAKILKALKGYNNLRCIENFREDILLLSGRPPYKLAPYKSSAHVALTRAFVEYCLNSKTAKAVFNWAKKTEIPDEMPFSTIHCNWKLKALGSFKASSSINRNSANYVVRYKMWIEDEPFGCHGKEVHDLCTFGPKDLVYLKKRHELFANKFLIHDFPTVPYRLRKTVLERTYLEYTGRLDYNVSFYENIPYEL